MGRNADLRTQVHTLAFISHTAATLLIIATIVILAVFLFVLRRSRLISRPEVIAVLITLLPIAGLALWRLRS